MGRDGTGHDPLPLSVCLSVLKAERTPGRNTLHGPRLCQSWSIT